MTTKLSHLPFAPLSVCLPAKVFILAAVIAFYAPTAVVVNAANWVNRTVNSVSGTFGDIEPQFGFESGLGTERLQWGDAFPNSFSSYMKWEGADHGLPPLGETVSPGQKFLAGYLTFGNGTVTSSSSTFNLEASLDVYIFGSEFYIDNHPLTEFGTWKIAIVQTLNYDIDEVADADYVYFRDFPWLGSFRVFEERTTRVPVYAKFGSVKPAAFGQVEDPSAGVILPSVVPDPEDPGVPEDLEPPTIAGCPVDRIEHTESGVCEATVRWTEPTASDNVGIASFTGTHAPGDTFPVGLTTVTYTAADGASNVSYCTFAVTVEDKEPPVVTAVSATPNLLNPPNHILVPITLNVAASDNCGPLTSKIIAVSSNQPVNGLGDGDQAPDWEITGDLTVNLRAERSGAGKDRIYTIIVESSDDSGNKTQSPVNVTVPHDMGR